MRKHSNGPDLTEEGTFDHGYAHTTNAPTEKATLDRERRPRGMKLRTVGIGILGLIVLVAVLSNQENKAVPLAAEASPKAEEPKTAAEPLPQADWQDTVDLLHPECRHTPIAQMTRAKLEECDMIERIFRGMSENIAKLREEKTREDQARAAPRAECHPTADIICERWSTGEPAKRGGARQ